MTRLGWRRPVVRVRTVPGGTDQYGDPLPGEATRTVLPDCLFSEAPTGVAVSAGVLATVTEPTAYWEGEHPDVRAGDRLEIEGTEWRVSGRPQRWPKGLAVTLAGAEGV